MSFDNMHNKFSVLHNICLIDISICTLCKIKMLNIYDFHNIFIKYTTSYLFIIL